LDKKLISQALIMASAYAKAISIAKDKIQLNCFCISCKLFS